MKNNYFSAITDIYQWGAITMKLVLVAEAYSGPIYEQREGTILKLATWTSTLSVSSKSFKKNKMTPIFQADSQMSQTWIVQSRNLSTANECWKDTKMHTNSIAILSQYLSWSFCVLKSYLFASLVDFYGQHKTKKQTHSKSYTDTIGSVWNLCRTGPVCRLDRYRYADPVLGLGVINVMLDGLTD